jgi:hypothetical protein
MTDQEIFDKAIEKAYPTGTTGRVGAWLVGIDEMKLTEINKAGLIRAIIFHHDFAKAFWGEQEYEYAPNGEKTDVKNRGWQYHLQMMVLEEKPIKYLEKFL